MVLFGDDALPDSDPIGQYLSKTWQTLPPLAPVESRDGIVALTAGNAALYFAPMPAPFP